MKTIVTFSGGKDSLSALLWIRNNFTKNFTTVFCDTGWENPLTYQYIEQDADIVIFIHRPTYYNPKAEDDNCVSWQNRGGLIIAKHRMGEKDSRVLFRHDNQFKKIWDDSVDIPEFGMPVLPF